jgi:hypothetical protein
MRAHGGSIRALGRYNILKSFGMKKFISLAIIVIFLPAISANGFANHTLSYVSSDNNQIIIKVIDGGWGNASVRDIQSVLYSTAEELLKYFPGKHLHPIIVEHDDEDGPITLYRRGPNNEYLIHLDVEDTNWAQFVYQFSHELTHVLARGENVKVNRHPNKWFEEVLCVTASLFTLRRMAVAQGAFPPYTGENNYAPFLRRYADYHMSKPRRQLPSTITLAQWYKEHAANLRSENVRSEEARNKQYIIASQLLPVFELHPDLWESISYLNLGQSDRSYSFENYLNNWYMNSPEKHKRVIREIINIFRE